MAVSKSTDTGKRLLPIDFSQLPFTGIVEKSIELEWSPEITDSVFITTIKTSWLMEEIGGNFKFIASVVSTYELVTDGHKLSVDDLLPIFKNSVKNLRDLFNEEEKRTGRKVTDIPYPPKEFFFEKISDFLEQFYRNQ